MKAVIGGEGVQAKIQSIEVRVNDIGGGRRYGVGV
jgi:hypothetical protein